MELGGAYRLEGGGGGFLNHHMAGKPQRVGTIFYGGSWHQETLSKNFHLAIGGGLGWIKWLINGAEKGFIFHAIISALYHFWWKFY